MRFLLSPLMSSSKKYAISISRGRKRFTRNQPAISSTPKFITLRLIVGSFRSRFGKHFKLSAPMASENPNETVRHNSRKFPINAGHKRAKMCVSANFQQLSVNVVVFYILSFPRSLLNASNREKSKHTMPREKRRKSLHITATNKNHQGSLLECPRKIAEKTIE